MGKKRGVFVPLFFHYSCLFSSRGIRQKGASVNVRYTDLNRGEGSGIVVFVAAEISPRVS